jgi:hypothetical protein
MAAAMYEKWLPLMFAKGLLLMYAKWLLPMCAKWLPLNICKKVAAKCTRNGCR